MTKKIKSIFVQIWDQTKLIKTRKTFSRDMFYSIVL